VTEEGSKKSVSLSRVKSADLRKSQVERQHEWLKCLDRLSDRRLKVSKNVKDHPGQWEPFAPELPTRKDYRTVLQNEVVFDIDSDNWDDIRFLASKLTQTLAKLNIRDISSITGGRGVHISFFFKPTGEQESKLRENNLTYRDLRIWLARRIADEAGIDKELIGIGKTIDLSVIDWDDDSKGHLLRTFGGSKNNNEGKPIGYKTLVRLFPKTKPVCKSLVDVEFPDERWIKPTKIPDDVFAEFIEDKKTCHQRKAK